MKKPGKSHKVYDYFECEKYVAHKLGIKDLRDTLGKFSREPYDDSVEYRDFWHYICKTNQVHNGGEIWIFEDEDAEDWQQEIIEAFLDAFGEGPYHVSW